MHASKAGTAYSITPDFIITEEDGKLQLSLNRSDIPKLRLNPVYAHLYEQKREKKKKENLNQRQKDEEKIIKLQVERATEFMDFLVQRDETLYKTMKAIMEWQKEYFLTGDKAKLRPMILENIAAATGLDKSTISRVSNSKYAQTDFGIIPLKALFAEAVGDDNTSSRELKEAIANLIRDENKLRPLKDDELVKLMSDKGYKIARRTIAKYREEMGIPVARLRKGLSSK
jgi:RNA polymerase sigma-54 factor